MTKVLVQIYADPADFRVLDTIRIRHHLKNTSQAYSVLIKEYEELANFVLEMRKKEAESRQKDPHAGKKPSNPMVNL